MHRIMFSMIFALALAQGPAFAHGGDSQAKNAERKPASDTEERAYGREGDPKAVARTIRITGSDKMRYTPSVIRVKQGETVRIVMNNAGKLLHEMVLGTREELAEHHALMKKFPGMEHDEPNMAHAKPGGTGEIIWRFTRAGEFEFACLIPGHWEAGMHGKIIVTAK